MVCLVYVQTKSGMDHCTCSGLQPKTSSTGAPGWQVGRSWIHAQDRVISVGLHAYTARCCSKQYCEMHSHTCMITPAFWGCINAQCWQPVRPVPHSTVVSYLSHHIDPAYACTAVSVANYSRLHILCTPHRQTTLDSPSCQLLAPHERSCSVVHDEQIDMNCFYTT